LNRWKVYSLLKRKNSKVTLGELLDVGETASETIEGIIEYNTMVKSNPGIYKEFNMKRERIANNLHDIGGI